MTSTDGTPNPSPSTTPEQPLTGPRPAVSTWTWIALLAGAAGLGGSILLWQKIDGMQEQLARQTTDATAQAMQAHALARDAQDLVQDANTKLSVMQTRINEMTLQREQFETLVDNLTRSRDDTLVVDIEAAVRMAQQQVQLTGNTVPLVATLQSSLKRLERAAQPRFAPLQKAIEQDLDNLSKSNVTDVSGLLIRLDDAVRLVDDLHLLNGPPVPDAVRQPEREASPAPTGDASELTPSSPTQWVWWRSWMQKIGQAALNEARGLLRVSEIANEEAMLMAPEQAFFVRENLKLQLLNARLAILARQYDAARADIAEAQATIGKHFVPDAPRTHQILVVLTQLQTNLQATKEPSLDNTLAVLSTLVSGQ